MKAIIVGAGVGGLCAAMALQQIGVETEIYEQAPEPRAAGAGLSLWPNAIHALRQIQLGGALDDIAVDIAGNIRRWDGVVLSAMDPQMVRARYGTSSVAVHRVDLMNALLDHVGDVARYGRRLARYEQDGTKIQVIFEDGTTATGDLLIGADGIHSQVRRQMQPTSHPVYRGYPGWRGVVNFPHVQVGDIWGESWGNGARFGLVPLSQERIYWFATVNHPAGQPPDDHHFTLRQLFGGWHRPIPDVITATPAAAILYNDLHDLEPLSTWVDGRAVLLGDAAHAMTPNMGQGACQAIEDALVLAKAIQGQPDLAQALDVYQQQRIPHTTKVVLRSRNIGQIGQLSNPLAVAMRNTAMRLLPADMTLKQLDFVLANRI